MTRSVKRAVLMSVRRLMSPPVESTPSTPIKLEKIPVLPMGAGVEMGRDGIGGARMAFTVAAGYGGRFVTITWDEDSTGVGSFVVVEIVTNGVDGYVVISVSIVHGHSRHTGYCVVGLNSDWG